MKTTLEIRDELLVRARKLAQRTGRPLRSVVEEGLRLVLLRDSATERYEMPDCSTGDPDAEDPLERLSWQDLRSEIYGEPPLR